MKKQMQMQMISEILDNIEKMAMQHDGKKFKPTSVDVVIAKPMHSRDEMEEDMDKDMEEEMPRGKKDLDDVLDEAHEEAMDDRDSMDEDDEEEMEEVSPVRSFKDRFRR